MKWYNKLWTKIKIFFKELLNIATNVACPILSALCAIAELCQLPGTVIEGIKKVEYKAFEVCGTAKQIAEYVENTEQQIIENMK